MTTNLLPAPTPILDASEEDTNIGNVLMRLGAITRQQLQSAVLHHRSLRGAAAKPLGEVLILRGDIDATMLSHALAVQQAERTGDVLGLLATLGKYVDGMEHRCRGLSDALDLYEACTVNA